MKISDHLSEDQLETITRLGCTELFLSRDGWFTAYAGGKRVYIGQLRNCNLSKIDPTEDITEST